MKKTIQFAGFSLFLFSAATLAHPGHFYLAADAGILTATFNNSYLDQTNIPPLNFQTTVTQNGYTGGLSAGYRKLHDHYFWGIELSQNFNMNSAVYTPGSSSSSNLSDKTRLDNNLDVLFVPGIRLSATVLTYMKLGLSLGWFDDYVTSAYGATNVIPTNFNSINKGVVGYAVGLGVMKSLCKHISVFTEANYHDYGNIGFPNFLNGSIPTMYTHSAHVYSYAAVVGAAYQFNE